MIYLPVEKLTEGMVLARDILGANPMIPFAVTGCKLNCCTIARMRDVGIQGAYIQAKLTEGIEPKDFVEPELKAKLLTDVRNTLRQGLKNFTFPADSKVFMDIAVVAESVVINVLNKDQYLFQMIDIRDYDSYTYSHSLYVGLLSVLLGRYMGLSAPQLNDLALCGLLHDIGKTELPIEITNKPGPLTKEEYNIMKQHPVLSYRKLKASGQFSELILEGIRAHHEKFDGSGYPLGLAGKDIPMYGRILAIADVYDALNSTRPYRKAWTPRRVFDYLMSCSNTHFDPELLGFFLQCISAYPVGTPVRLSDGSTAVVRDNTPGFSLRPIIRFLTPASKSGTEIDLSVECLNLTILDNELD